MFFLLFNIIFLNRCFLIETIINKNMERLLKMSNYGNWTHGCRMHSVDYVELINIMTTSTLGSKISPADQRAKNLIYHFYYSLALNGNLNLDFWVRLMDNSRDQSPSHTFLSYPDSNNVLGFLHLHSLHRTLWFIVRSYYHVEYLHFPETWSKDWANLILVSIKNL